MTDSVLIVLLHVGLSDQAGIARPCDDTLLAPFPAHRFSAQYVPVLLLYGLLYCSESNYTESAILHILVYIKCYSLW